MALWNRLWRSSLKKDPCFYSSKQDLLLKTLWMIHPPFIRRRKMLSKGQDLWLSKRYGWEILRSLKYWMRSKWSTPNYTQMKNGRKEKRTNHLAMHLKTDILKWSMWKGRIWSSRRRTISYTKLRNKGIFRR